jgi:hypothetical protein
MLLTSEASVSGFGAVLYCKVNFLMAGPTVQ